MIFFFLIYPQTSSDSLLCVPLLYSLGIQNMIFISAWAFLVAPVVKNLPANAGDTRDMGSIAGLGRSLGEGNGDPVQYSCLENSMHRGAWWATVYGVTKSRTQLSIHALFHISSLSSWLLLYAYHEVYRKHFIGKIVLFLLSSSKLKILFLNARLYGKFNSSNF